MAHTVAGGVIRQGNGRFRGRGDRRALLCRGRRIACPRDLRTVERRVGRGRGREAAALDDIAVEKLLRHLVNEPRRMRVLRAAVQQAALRAGQIQLLLGAGNCHVAQTAFFLHILGVFHCAEAGEQAVLHAGEKHDRELKSLCRVHGHHDNGILVLARLVGVRVKRHVLQKIAERRVFVLFLVINDVGFQFFDVLDAAFLLGAALELKRTDVAALVEQLIVQLGKRNKLAQPAQIFHHFAELFHRRRAARQGRVFGGVTYNVIERHAVFHCELHRGFHRFVADFTRRNIDDAAQAQFVRRVLNNPQVGKHILDLGAGEEIASLVDTVGHARSNERGGDVVRQDVVAVEHGEIAPAAALLDALADSIRNIGGLTLLRVRTVQLDFRAIAVVGP